MTTLKGNIISLRALEPTDLKYLYQIENNESFWNVSNTQKPFSKDLLQQYLNNSHLDIYEIKQLRLVVTENKTNTQVGFIDLFDFEPKHRRAGIGILIDNTHQNKGYGSLALSLMIDYCFKHLDLHQLYANITSNNIKSITLFENQGFILVGSKKDWIYLNQQYYNELLYQLINE